MKKLNILLLLPFFLLSWACSDTDKNPWLGNLPEPEAISLLTPVADAELGDVKDGITILDDSTLMFVLTAPGKEEVYWVSAFTFWKAKNKFVMNKEGERFWIQIRGFDPKKEYAFQYLIDETIRIADPYSTKTTDSNDQYISGDIYPNLMTYPKEAKEIASVVSTQPNTYSWKVQNFKVENPENMVVYEMLLRDFTEERSIKAAQAKIPYLKELGVNVIELMPFNEFEGNESWGYNPSFFFATDKAYGTETAYKEFVDECHANGIAVVMDMVFNHAYGQCPLVRMYMDENYKVTTDNPWFNVEAPHQQYSWGYDFNHESKYTQDFIDRVTKYWMNEYKIDGFRFDFTKGFTNKPTTGDDDLSAKDDSRIAILKRMTDAIKAVNADAVVVFEHLTGNEEEKTLSDYGIFLWGNMNYNYSQVAMGWGDNNLNWSSYKERGWTNPTLVSYMESHDEERVMFKTLSYGNSTEAANGYDVKDLNTALARSGAAAVLYFSIPGPKMIWQFGELGYDYELNDDRLAPKPVRWDYYDVPERKALYDLYSMMIKLRKDNKAFTTTDFVLGMGEGLFKQVLLKSPSGDVCVVANLGVTNQSGEVNFGSTGEWTEHFTNNKLNVTSANLSVALAPGEYRIYKK